MVLWQLPESGRVSRGVPSSKACCGAVSPVSLLGCIQPRVLLWAIAPAGTLMTSCCIVRDKRGLRHLVPLQLPEARIYHACLSPHTTTNASRQREADLGVESARLW